jgi:hypothetical protein
MIEWLVELTDVKNEESFGITEESSLFVSVFVHTYPCSLGLTLAIDDC